ncbi:short-chain dehydrogenase [Longispora fulva]|uniref:Rhamnose utilization protein RhaD (Predicted bifunctional aldolase and dehydrogenase)/NAD(P)-dependent dehydrogenase (Short-subunit alcohol dehydrogenase family) n=1 Tax=Longispora fulva TaxID=619741 RepID=A0A8J7GAY4_9ACTN|nr:bifunctional aldolase/short-chain dehydrogenase [Longispora fulva]MBG6135520.1 rhamnose utilization protein RhaD (predicted bifunctional aldolase and dehydrogenase)/NAD(P)-dependent dehydrogenase (short-subunit alcohol dehydrogenase family) [Longispora fulva]GIG56240.1 short-chain dehydrogenase [Longispora fulva]
MRDRWNDAEAPADPLGQCVYGSRLLGAEPGLVLHGGGNTSVKTTTTDLDGSEVEVLHVKGSGWNLATIEPAGFAPLRMARLRELLTLPALSDPDMMNALRCSSLDAGAPDPSVESLLHALLPYPAVLHSHADALIAWTNQPDGAARVRELFGKAVVVVPYVMPGFDLARRCADTVLDELTDETVGIVLLNHGLFTFGADTREAYRRHVDLISRIEAALPVPPVSDSPAPEFPALEQARLRAELSGLVGAPVILRRHEDPAVRAFVEHPELAALAGRGPLTPDHVIRTKRVPLVGRDLDGYTRDYRAYFAANADRRGTELTMLDPAPRVLLDRAFGLLTAGRRAADAQIAADIYRHTVAVIGQAEQLDGYRALPAPDIFDVEYWDLEQAKLRMAGAPAEFTGEVALVTGAASGIGRACAEALLARGAAVLAVDVDPGVSDLFAGSDRLGVLADVTDADALAAAVAAGVDRFGGIDMVVASAGVFPASRPLADWDQAEWRRTMAVNADATAALFALVHPYLALAPRGGRVVLVASKNVPAPGPGAAAYSASKAAATQLARIAALEWAADGIRVNLVHPDAVFDTGLWSPELLAQRAAHYGMTVQAYRRRNLLGTELTSARVGALVATMCSDVFSGTTGTQVPIDGGNERVI